MFSFKKKKPTPKIVYRIRELNKKVEFLQNCIGSSNCTELWNIYSLNTNCGLRKIHTTNSSLAYFNESGKVFKLDAYWVNNQHTIKVEPFPIDLTVDEIDLAVLEFEIAVDKEYKEFLKKAQYHASVEKGIEEL